MQWFRGEMHADFKIAHGTQLFYSSIRKIFYPDDRAQVDTIAYRSWQVYFALESVP